MAVTEQVLRGPTLMLAGAEVTVAQRCIVMVFGRGIVAGIYPTAVRVVVGDSTTTYALPW